jgi:hypothetical protein
MRTTRFLGHVDIKTVKDTKTFGGAQCQAYNGTGIVDTRPRCCICGGRGFVRAI